MKVILYARVSTGEGFSLGGCCVAKTMRTSWKPKLTEGGRGVGIQGLQTAVATDANDSRALRCSGYLQPKVS
jgi:hypothetical protein